MLGLQLFFLGCTTSRPVIDNSAVLKDHQAPYKVFSIGYWDRGYNILTLTDADHQYLVIKTRQNLSLKVGDIYQPENSGH